MNAITKTEQARPSLIAMLAAKHNMEPEAFAKTVRATVMPAQHTTEQFAALMLVAQQYDLNPIVKEIYAFPAKGGGIVPIVSIDGWINLVNSHPQSDGFEFEFEHQEGKLISCTCRMYRKDRSRPVAVTEYLAECKRATEPWKMEHRMLRHKAMIQAARLAFGFSGVYDEDEGTKIAEMRDVTPPAPPAPPKPPLPSTESVRAADETVTVDGEIITDEPASEAQADGDQFDTNQFFEDLEIAMAGAKDADQVEAVWVEFDPLATFDGDDVNIGIATAIKNRRLKALGGR